MITLLFPTLLALAPQAPESRKYAVLVDARANDEFLPAAKALAEFHRGTVHRININELDKAFADLKKLRPDFVVFVLPPQKIDVDLAHEVLRRSTELDDDPFSDFEYGFVTGRDGAAASRFVERIKQAWQREYGRKVGMFGSWEGVLPPSTQPLSSMKAMKADAEAHFVRTRDPEAAQKKASRAGLDRCKDKDLLMFFSHGYADEMVACFRAPDVRDWKVNLAPAILVNCACYNGAPARWYAQGPKGAEDRTVSPNESVCLAILDSGVPAYIAGIDPWHAPLAFQIVGHILDDGMRLGQAAKIMHDRLALEFLPERIKFEPTLKNPKRFIGEGTNNRRHNGGAMIFYGDPAFAPFGKSASRLTFADVKETEGRMNVRMGNQPMLDGQPGEDFMIPMNRLLDYYSVKTANLMKEISMEVYRVVPLPEGRKEAPQLRVVSARSGKQDVPTLPVRTVVEQTPHGNLLHIRVPLDVRAIGSHWPMTISKQGLEVMVEEER